MPEPDSTITSPAKKKTLDSETPVNGEHSQENTPEETKQHSETQSETIGEKRILRYKKRKPKKRKPKKRKGQDKRKVQ